MVKRASEVAAALATGDDTRLGQAVRPVPGEQTVVQVTDAAGTVVVASPDVEGEPPLSPMRPATGQTLWEQRSLPVDREEPFRIAAMGIDSPHGRRVVLVGAPRAAGTGSRTCADHRPDDRAAPAGPRRRHRHLRVRGPGRERRTAPLRRRRQPRDAQPARDHPGRPRHPRHQPGPARGGSTAGGTVAGRVRAAGSAGGRPSPPGTRRRARPRPAPPCHPRGGRQRRPGLSRPG